MTGDIVLLVYALGTAVATAHIYWLLNKFFGASPLELCDDCRATYHTLARLLEAMDARWNRAFYLPPLLILMAATWPVTVPRGIIKQAIKGKHVCADVIRRK